MKIFYVRAITTKLRLGVALLGCCAAARAGHLNGPSRRLSFWYPRKKSIGRLIPVAHPPGPVAATTGPDSVWLPSGLYPSAANHPGQKLTEQEWDAEPELPQLRSAYGYVAHTPFVITDSGQRPPSKGKAPSACLNVNIKAVNAVSRLKVTLSNVAGQPFLFNGGLEVSFSVPRASALRTGRYASSAFNRVVGIGHSLHISRAVSGDPSTRGRDLETGNFMFTAHIDSAYSTWYTPLGALIHYVVDVRGKGAHRWPC